MKKFNLFKMLAVLIVLITSINTAWAKYVYVDRSLCNDYGTPYIHYWGGATDTHIASTCVEGDLFKAEIPDDATTWQVCRESGGSYYNYFGGSGMSLDSYDVLYMTRWKDGEGGCKGYWYKYQTRTYSGTEKIFFKNFKPSGWSKYWCDDGLTCWIHFFNMATGASYDVKLSDNGGGIFEGTAGAGTYSDVILVRCSSTDKITWPNPREANRSLAFSVGGDGSKNMIDDLSPGDWTDIHGGWTKYAKTPAVIGSMNGWNVEANPATSSRWDNSKEIKIIPVTLAASTSYTFRVITGQSEYGASDLTITGATKDGSWEGYSTGADKDVTITTGEAGEYIFQYNTSSNYVAVFYPKARLTKNKYLYFDGSANTAWKGKDPYHAKFSYQYYDSHIEHSYIFCSNDTAKEDHIFYTMVPNETSIGRVQVMCMYTDHSAQHYYANSNDASERTSSAPNCLIAPAAGNDGIALTWGTYCPPMSEASLSDNSTSKISWQTGSGTSGDPYLVPASGTIKVSAEAESAVDDDNMTAKYDFKVNTGSGASSEQNSTSTTFDKTSLSNNTTYEVSVEPYNYYNSTSGTKNTSATHIWYRALTMYSVTHSMTNITKSAGREDAGAAAHYLAYSSTYAAAAGYKLPTTITVKFGETTKDAGTDYTWNSSTGVLSIPVNKIDGNVTVKVDGVAKQCTVSFNKVSGTGGDGSATATYDAAMPDIEIPHRIGYKFAGYYDNAEYSGTKYYDEDGHSAHLWDKDTETTTNLYAKWDTHVKNFVGYGEGAESVKWNVAANWSDGIVPTDDYSEIHIKRGVNIGEDESYHVGKIVIDAGSITLINGGSLEVEGTITRTDDAATETYDISLSSTGSEQSALILDNSAGTTKASVALYTSAKYDPSTSGYSFQYVAVPMNVVNVSDAFSGEGVYTFVWNEGTGWERRSYYYSLFGFEAVGVTSKDGLTAHTTGTLVSTATRNVTLAYTSGDADKVGMNMIGNSWTAPISIAALHGKITGKAESTVYIYESGSWVGYATGSAGSGDVIPAMQAYLIKANSGGGSLELDYDKVVRVVPAANRNAALRAPKREVMTDMNDMYLHVSDGERTTRLRLCEDAQKFTNEFDNGWEARYIEGDGRSGQLYAQTDDKMTILATPNLEGTVVGFIPGVSTNYTISFEGDGTGYYLNDVVTGKSTLIDEANTYNFKSDENTNATRFVVSKMPLMPTGVDEVADGSKARKQMIDGTLYIIRDGRIYDAQGALVK